MSISCSTDNNACKMKTSIGEGGDRSGKSYEEKHWVSKQSGSGPMLRETRPQRSWCVTAVVPPQQRCLRSRTKLLAFRSKLRLPTLPFPMRESQSYRRDLILTQGGIFKSFTSSTRVYMPICSLFSKGEAFYSLSFFCLFFGNKRGGSLPKEL